MEEYNLSNLKRVGDLKNLEIENFYLPKLNYLNKIVLLKSKFINLPELETVNYSIIAPKSIEINLPKIKKINKFISVNCDTRLNFHNKFNNKIEKKDII